MVTIVVAEPVDVLDAGEVADFGRGEAANSRGRRAPPFARMALGCAVRRGLAESVVRWWARVASLDDVVRAVPPAVRPVARHPAAGQAMFVPPDPAHAAVAGAVFAGPPVGPLVVD